MIKFVNAKINLGLRVESKRPDGYHNLSTLFYPIGIHAGTVVDRGRLADILEITPSKSDSLSLTGKPIYCDTQSNLVWKALQAFREVYPSLPQVDIKLEKHIPSQAGMGGGSADASFALKAFNELCGNPLSKQQLADMALKLGADCPFFIYNTPMFASGIGEVFTSATINLSGLWVTILKPNVNISTAQAFSNITPCKPKLSIQEIVSQPIEKWRELLVNDFETSMFRLYPEIAILKEHLYAHGAIYASMSGSGSAFYGIYYSETDARKAAESIDVEYNTIALL